MTKYNSTLRDKSSVKFSSDYVINQMNQMIENVESKYEYDINGNMIKEMSKKQVNTAYYFEYNDEGKLKKVLNLNNQNCSYSYDCLERLRLISCVETGNYTFKYHANALFKDPLSLTMPNGTVIYFASLPYSTLITAILIGGHLPTTIYTPININQNQLLPDLNTQKPIVGPNVPITSNGGNGIVPTINSNQNYFINSQNNKPTWLTNNNLLTPLNPFTVGSYLQNTYNPTIQSLNWNLNQAFNSINNQINLPLQTNNNPLNFNFGQIGPIKPTVLSTNLPLTLPSKPSINVNSYPNTVDLAQSFNSYRVSICKKLGFKTTKLAKQLCRDYLNSTQNKIAVNFFQLCGALTAALVEYADSGSLFQAGLEFAANLNPFINLAYYAAKVVCSPSDGAKDTFTNFPSSRIMNDLNDKIKDKLVKDKKFPKPVQCAAGIADYVGGYLIDKLLGYLWDWALSLDPNDIIGPEAYGSERFIAKLERFRFKIRYENMANTSAPAQVVRIISKVDDLFDLRSISFTAYGFNQFERKLDENEDGGNQNNNKVSYINQVIKDEALFGSDQYEIRVFAAVDLSKRELVWQLRTIDIQTG
jgi:hypothetical protein